METDNPLYEKKEPKVERDVVMDSIFILCDKDRQSKFTVESIFGPETTQRDLDKHISGLAGLLNASLKGRDTISDQLTVSQDQTL